MNDLRQAWLMVSFAIGATLLAGCAAHDAGESPEAPTPANLAGNWLLAGTLPQVTASSAQSNGFAASFDVQGDQVVGSAVLRFVCNNVATGVSYGRLLRGTIAPDGTFVLTTPTPPSAPTIEALTVKGTVPAGVGQAWTGSYTLLAAGQDLPGSCTTPQQGTFTATAVADVTGSWSGSGAFTMIPGVPSLPPPTIELTLQQGGPLYGPAGPTAPSRLALSGSIEISGFPCFSKGVSSTSLSSLVSGDQINLELVMDDGSTAELVGSIKDIAARQLSLALLRVMGGKCSGLYPWGIAGLTVQR